MYPCALIWRSAVLSTLPSTFSLVAFNCLPVTASVELFVNAASARLVTLAPPTFTPAPLIVTVLPAPVKVNPVSPVIDVIPVNAGFTLYL